MYFILDKIAIQLHNFIFDGCQVSRLMTQILSLLLPTDLK